MSTYIWLVMINRWFAKRFLHPDIVAEYKYIFIWDEDLGVENFHPGRYVPLCLLFLLNNTIQKKNLVPLSSSISSKVWSTLGALDSTSSDFIMELSFILSWFCNTFVVARHGCEWCYHDFFFLLFLWLFSALTCDPQWDTAVLMKSQFREDSLDCTVL